MSLQQKEQEALAKFAVKSTQWHGMLEFRTLAETVPAAIFATDAAGRNVYTNSFYQRYSGLTFDQLLGRGFMQLVHPDDVAALIDYWTARRCSPEPFEVEHRLRRHDGVYRWHMVRGAPVKDAEGRVLRWIGTCTDVDDLRTALAQAEESRELVESLGALTDALVYAKDADGNFTLANAATLDVLGLPAGSVIGQQTDALGGKTDDVARIYSVDQLVMRTGKIHTVEEYWTSPDGTSRIFRSSKGPWRRADGTIGIVAITTDVTREQQLESALAQKNRQFDQLLDSLPILLWITGPDGQMLVQNNLWVDYSGLPRGDDAPVSFADVVDPIALPAFADQWRACIAHGDVLDTVVGLFDQLAGRHVPHRLTAFPHRDDDGHVTGWVGSAIPV